MISSIPSNYANTIAPFAPVGRAPVSQESEDLKSSSFRPAEQLAEAGRALNRRFPDERPNDDVERDRLERDARAKSASDDVQIKAELEQIQALAARDREVRAHEQAHASVAGQYARGTSYTYQRGPDGVSYAIGGEVQIDTSPIPGDPEATLRKAQQLRRAANAPAEPSSQDARVAAQAAQMEQQARIELREQQAIEAQERTAAVAPAGETSSTSSEPNRELDTEARREAAAQEAEEKKARLAEEEQRLQEDQQRFEAEQRQLDQRQARAELFNEFAKRNIDINRRLLEIGVFDSSPGVGGLLNQRV
uniref:putative metalloprotease CJM1_0395 family protein n=1 Tax=Cellvibrio fontiphilus TaxID=1815559 RepID=UPI002B4C1A93|nr:putative metalloprotease CJM1_0395 family protein [Cellvibrio fontiphilus]